MNLTAWRITPAASSANAFNGEGARLYGGRWNSPGRAAVYASGSRALAALEVLVHLSPAIASRQQFLLYQIAFADSLVDDLHPRKVHPSLLSAAIHPDTQYLGDHWIDSASNPVLRIPSAIIPAEHNYLLNPNHPLFNKLKIATPTPFSLDPRLNT